MNDDDFWNIIALFDWEQSDDNDAVLEPAIDALASRGIDDIYAFHNLMAEKLHALDTREHCRACYAGELDPDDGDDYISADDFLYQRCVVVANGRKLFEAALRDPMEMPQNLEFESLLYLPGQAYDRKTGEEYDHAAPVSYESFENKLGWAPTPTTKPGKFTGPSIPPGNRRPT